MTNLSTILRKDGIRQLLIGTFLILFAIVLIGTMVYTSFHLALIVVVITTFVTGSILLVSGFNDWYLSKNSQLRMKQTEEMYTSSIWPRRMYMEQTMKEVNFYDMNGQLYETTQTEKPSKVKQTSRFIGMIGSSLTGAAAILSIIPRKYEIKMDNVSFFLQKRGGIGWRSYVFDQEGKCIGLIDNPGKTSRQFLQYTEEQGVRWKASKDSIGFIVLSNDKDEEIGVMKPGGIPVEAADLFIKGNGILIDWSEPMQVPHSLVLFSLAIFRKYYPS